MKTIEFTKSIMKIMKISEFQLKNNENHENPIISHQKYEDHCNPENSQIMTIMKILEFHWRNMKIIKIPEFNARMKKIMKILTFHLLIMKIMKIIEINQRNTKL